MSHNLEYCQLCSQPTGHAGAGEDSIFVETNGRTIGPLCHECTDRIRQWVIDDGGLVSPAYHEADCERLVAAAVQAERERWVQACLRICAGWTDEQVKAALAAVETIQKEVKTNG